MVLLADDADCDIKGDQTQTAVQDRILLMHGLTCKSFQTYSVKKRRSKQEPMQCPSELRLHNTAFQGNLNAAEKRFHQATMLCAHAWSAWAVHRSIVVANKRLPGAVFASQAVSGLSSQSIASQVRQLVAGCHSPHMQPGRAHGAQTRNDGLGFVNDLGL